MKRNTFIAAWAATMILLWIAGMGCVWLIGQMLGGCSGVVWETGCRHDALVCAIVAEEHLGPDNARVCVGHTETGKLHGQAQARIRGEWVWLRHWDGEVYEVSQDAFRDEKCMSKDKLIETYFGGRP